MILIAAVLGFLMALAMLWLALMFLIMFGGTEYSTHRARNRQKLERYAGVRMRPVIPAITWTIDESAPADGRAIAS